MPTLSSKLGRQSCWVACLFVCVSESSHRKKVPGRISKYEALKECRAAKNIHKIEKSLEAQTLQSSEGIATFRVGNSIKGR